MSKFAGEESIQHHKQNVGKQQESIIRRKKYELTLNIGRPIIITVYLKPAIYLI